MKRLCGMIFLGLVLVSAADVETRRAEEVGKTYKEYKAATGRVYQDVTITAINAGGISLTHADGTARLRFEHLTPEQREKFGITQNAAAEIYAAEQKAKAAQEAKLAEQEKAHQEWLAKQVAAKAKSDEWLAENPSGVIRHGKTVIESTLEIPTFPIIKSSQGGVLYGDPRHSPSRTTYYHGGYVYPAAYGYHPGRYYYPYQPPRSHCTPTHRNSIFHFTIK